VCVEERLMAQLTLLAAAVVMPLAIAHSWTGVRVSAQEPHLTGQWRVEYHFSDGPTSALQFDARQSGKGSFLSIDTRRSSLAPAVPGKAVWTQTSTRVSFSGEVEIPIGNVGYYMRKLEFEGAFASSSVIVGDVADVSDVAASQSSVPPAKGTFKATRMHGSKESPGPPN
jgi:hypothetical protein